jgi:hypothetical protein
MRAIHIALIGAALIVGASTVGVAQDPLSAARKSAQKAVDATNAHTEAMQHPEGQAAKPTASAAKAAPAAQGSASKPVKVASVANAADKAAAPTTPAPDTAAPPPTIYRESFMYEADGRRDPFNSLLTTNELRPALSDLRLTGILYDHTGRHSVATLRDLGTNAQYRVTTGSTLGRMRVSNIRYTTVVFTIDEFGTTRQDSLVLRDTTKARGK